MNERIGWNITMQQIHIFLQAMELKNFSKVAATLNFTPSMVSKTIISLENELGFELFIRKPHELTPTPAAILLAAEWRQLIGSYDNTINKVRSFYYNQTFRIVLGFVDSSMMIDSYIKNSIRAYCTVNPDLNLIAEKHDMHRSAELLNFGMLDLAITNEMEIPYLNEHSLRWDKLCDTKVTAYVPVQNPLFSRTALSFSDLKDQSFVSLDTKMHPYYNRWLFTLCASYGFVPQVDSYFRTVRSLLFGLDLQNHIFLGDSITLDWCNEHLKAFELPSVSSAIIVYKKSASKKIIDFKNYLIEHYPLQPQ